MPLVFTLQQSRAERSREFNFTVHFHSSLLVLKGPWPVMLTGFLLFFFRSASLVFISFSSYFLSRDLVRETGKKCSLVPLGVFIFGFPLFVVSEAILFSAIFWASFHFTSSPFFSFQEALFLPMARVKHRLRL